jgi:hypothetical protein
MHDQLWQKSLWKETSEMLMREVPATVNSEIVTVIAKPDV